MYFIKIKLLKLLFKLLRRNPGNMPMVQYWKFNESAPAMVTSINGSLVMKIEGEKEVFPGFPRGYLLFGTLSKLKHEIKTRLFNESWKQLDEGKNGNEIVSYVKIFIEKELTELVEKAKYDMTPYSKMVKPVKEIYRAFEVLEKENPKNRKLKVLKEAITYVLQEDDAYRFRLQWIVSIFNPSSWWFKLFFRNPIKDFELALSELENAEIIGDMKERVRLFKRIVMTALKDESIKILFKQLCKEVNWNKVKLSKADKYYFRGKYFKVDYPYLEY